MTTYSTSSFSTPARSSAARMTIEPSSVACLSASEPPSFPNGVRTALTITDRAMSLTVPTAVRTLRWHDSCHSHLLLGLALRAGREPAPALSYARDNPFRSPATFLTEGLFVSPPSHPRSRHDRRTRHRNRSRH